METTRIAGDRRYYFVAGQSVELWEHPEQPFGWGPEEMASYAANGSWSLLFNALVLSSLLDPRTGD